METHCLSGKSPIRVGFVDSESPAGIQGHLAIAVSCKGQAGSLGHIKRGRGGGSSVAAISWNNRGVDGMPFCRQIVVMVIRGRACMAVMAGSFSCLRQT